MKPLVKYVGGKTKLARELGLLIPPFSGTYYEPFCGGAALFAHLYGLGRIRHAILSDLNDELIQLYRDVKQDPSVLIDELIALDQQYGLSDAVAAEAMFYTIRGDWNSGKRSSARYVFLKQTSFNGLWRVNLKGHINMPWGKYGHHGYGPPKILDIDNINEWSEALKIADVRCQSALDVEANEGDVVYMDPPYLGTFDSYMAGGFSAKDLTSILVRAKELTSKGVFVLMSNSTHAKPLVDAVWKNSSKRDVKTMYSVNSKGSGRANKTEVAIWSKERHTPAHQTWLFYPRSYQTSLFK